jgi:Fe2+ transport system protein FeoA
MNISDLKIGQKATILKINADKSLKMRLQSFGIYKGVEIEVKEFSIGKQNVEISIDESLIGLRAIEMKMIEVKNYNF